MKHNFKVGDKVFEYTQGWMKVIDEDDRKVVLKDSEGMSHYYYSKDIKVLSFTEYTLDGYSKERPVEEFKIGSVGYFWDYDDFSGCIYSKLINICHNSDYKYESISENRYKYFSLTPPEIK